MDRLPAAQPLTLSDMIAYQEQSIVSRTLVDRPSGTVTLFAFDDGQSLSEHTAPFDALVQVVEGEVEVLIAGKPVQLKGGEVVLMPASQPHALKAIRKFKMLLTMIRS